MLYVKKNELCVDLDERRSQKLAKKKIILLNVNVNGTQCKMNFYTSESEYGEEYFS